MYKVECKTNVLNNTEMHRLFSGYKVLEDQGDIYLKYERFFVNKEEAIRFLQQRAVIVSESDAELLSMYADIRLNNQLQYKFLKAYLKEI
jgi:hypothetical protein